MNYARFSLLAVIAFSGTVSAAMTPAPSPSASASATYNIRWGIKIPVRDEVELNATLHLPQEIEKSGRIPVNVTITSYISDTYHERATYFAGEFIPFVNGRSDGYDVVEWLVRQLFCDGRLGMWGGSYAGFDQWAAAKELPPHLFTIVPAAAAHPGLDAPYYNNIGQPYFVQWLTLTNGRAAQDRLLDDSSYLRTKLLAAYQQHIPV